MKNSIPGYMSNQELSELHHLFEKFNFEGAIGVEVGSMLGRSSYQISKTVSRGKLYCIDIWNGWRTSSDWPEEKVIKNNFPKLGTKIDLETFLIHTADCPNIIPIQGFSPSVVKGWVEPIDFLFLDGSHFNPSDWENIEFWLPHIKPGGILSGHDYRPEVPNEWPDVIANVQRLEKLLGQKVSRPKSTSIWFFEI